MRRTNLLLTPLILFAFYTTSYAQSYTISGFITDVATGEKLIGANIFEARSGSGTTSNNFGFYSLTVPADTAVLAYSYIGYQTTPNTLLIKEDTELNIGLNNAISLEAVEVIASKVDRIEENVQMSRIDIPIAQIKKVPALLGEVDVIKTLQLLPGVQSGGEGQTGMYVRGGSPDQNLILLDGVPVYSISHVAGLFSVFNADAIKNVSLLKGGFPARYGGRLSSVLEVNMKDGNNQEFHGEGSIGLITSKLTLEGPINKGKTSFLVSGRRTYIDLLVRPIAKFAAKKEGFDLRPKLHFYDFNAKVNHTFNSKHRLDLSIYNGSDILFSRIKDKEDTFAGGLDWGNWISALRWNMKVSPKAFSNTTLIFSDYQFNSSVEVDQGNGTDKTTFKSKYLSGIQDIGLKWDLDWIPNPKHYFRVGLGATRHQYNPGALTFKVQDADSNLDTLVGSDKTISLELYTYLEDEMDFGRLKMNLGIHVSGFKTEGQFYSSIQPRLNFRYLLDRRIALKASFNTMTQYINLLTTEALSLPTDLWVPSTKKVKPQQAWQAALGIAKSYSNFEVSIEAYYKKMQNTVSFKQGSSFLFGLDNKWEDKITQGEGETYGSEFFVQKKTGKTTGWLGYTLSWNNRTFPDINSGRTFPFKYDRRHDLSLVVNHDFNDRISLSGSWVYGTGNAISLPFEKFDVQIPRYQNPRLNYTYEIKQLADKNSFRMTNYHRLDIGIRFSKQKKRHLRTWSFGAYNTYLHKNPYFVYASEQTVYDPDTAQVIEEVTKFKEVSLIPFVLPYFSYSFKF